jgi:hypothetical protein
MLLTLSTDQSLFGFNVPTLKDASGHVVDREAPRFYEHDTEAATERLIMRNRRAGHLTAE